ncbi:MAG: hypothetical protein WCS76_02465 [Bacilli bacterium]|jgi:hypothetical protein|nr:hypothetical protein [Candidatus Saccharimonadaceae bacterium]MDD3938568.1 hypothetical protein [Bacilli bacterium]
MQVLFIVLNDLSYESEILKVFIEKKVRGATIIDSEGMAKAVLKNEGADFFFNGPFANSLPKNIGDSKTFFTVIPNDELLQELVSDIQKLLLTSNSETIGFMFAVPVQGIYPLKKKTK